MTNPKIEKVNTDIAKAKTKIAEYTARLRSLERHKTSLENEEIIAIYRREKFNDDEFSALLRSQRKSDSAAPDSIEPNTKTEGMQGESKIEITEKKGEEFNV
jgi:hypothetical protein